MINQNENQIDYQIEKNLINQTDKNFCLRIFKEQIDLINELPEGEREKVLYYAVTSAFQTIDKKEEKSSLNHFENQNENAYISVSVSVSVSNYLNLIYNSLTKISKTVLNLLVKTMEVKEFSSNYGGKRKNSGRKQKIEQIPENLDDKCSVDYSTANPDIEVCFSIYRKECPKLAPLGFEPRNRDVRQMLAKFLEEVQEVSYFEQVCKKANNLKYIANHLIDFKSLLNNHIGIMNGKYEEKEQSVYKDFEPTPLEEYIT